MKKFLSKIGYYPLLFLSTAQAEITTPDPPSGVPDTGLVGMLSTIANTILGLLGVVAILFIIIGGFQYITSSGNPDQVGKAKNTIFYAIIGLVVAILAWVVINFVIDSLTPRTI